MCTCMCVYMRALVQTCCERATIGIKGSGVDRPEVTLDLADFSLVDFVVKHCLSHKQILCVWFCV